MAEVNDSISNMVRTFRVSELQVLLGYAGRNKSGRKTELLNRALQLVQKNCSAAIEMRVHDLYKKSEANKRKATIKAAQETSSRLKSISALSTLPNFLGTDSNGIFDYLNEDREALSLLSQPIPCDVTLKPLPFYENLDIILPPMSLSNNLTLKNQEAAFSFHLTPHQVQIFEENRIKNFGKFETSVQIQVRFCLLERSCEQKDEFPSGCSLKVNNRIVSLPPPIQTNKPNVEPKRPSRPVNITSFCKISNHSTNQIVVGWTLPTTHKNFCVSIYLVKQLNSTILLQQLKQKGNRHQDHTKALIKEKLMPDRDSEIAIASLRGSLQCPLGKMRIKIPCRFITCNHLQCFDAETYIMMNERKPTWQCPVCDKAADYRDLVIDGYFVEILKDCPLKHKEIEFFPDSTWKALTLKKNLKRSDSCESFESDDDVINSNKSIVVSEWNENTKTSHKIIPCVDLTESGDEDIITPPETVNCYSDTPSTSTPASSDSESEVDSHNYRKKSSPGTTGSFINDNKQLNNCSPLKKRARVLSSSTTNTNESCTDLINSNLNENDPLDFSLNGNISPLNHSNIVSQSTKTSSNSNTDLFSFIASTKVTTNFQATSNLNSDMYKQLIPPPAHTKPVHTVSSSAPLNLYQTYPFLSSNASSLDFESQNYWPRRNNGFDFSLNQFYQNTSTTSSNYLLNNSHRSFDNDYPRYFSSNSDTDNDFY